MKIIAAIFSLLVGAAGWHYLFYSRAAAKLATVENDHLNQRRIRLRKVCGFAMMLLAICFLTLFWTFQPDDSPLAYLLMILAVMLLLLAVVILALIDMRLTLQLRRRRKRDTP